MGEGIAKAIQEEDGTIFDVYDTYTNFYPGSGFSSDWAVVQGVTYSMTFELQDRGRYGFLYPPSKIEDAVTEVWKGIEFFGKEIARQSQQGYFS
ncbi:carboxypeptidase A4 [Hyalella azteca]|uniref:Carboxypeptidase A4 n=1 Tax=Hyalella azteca TaxID=294128 RepID=A0A8B7P9Q2_HYAAZ|nr:carboxypeptidase A4 [Hyalella azteca]